jgi:hypothetical protein
MVKRADLAHASSASPRIKLQLENATHQPVRVPGQLSFVGGCGLGLVVSTSAVSTSAASVVSTLVVSTSAVSASAVSTVTLRVVHRRLYI